VLRIANIILVVFVLSLAAWFIWSINSPGPIAFFVGNIVELVVETGFLVLWGYSLVKLSRQLTYREKLIPNWRKFEWHAVLLLEYLVFFTIGTSCMIFGRSTYYFQGWVNLMTAIASIFQTACFILVNYVMLPISQ
jgi:hypothetical protein